ncbi:MAG: ABC transporter ATP-binding protein [Chloroflexi bacterium UTCFX4]|nr:MAG: ABC transporter ATP-binding protein [Chloroflexi bacterium UTCFX4]
MVQNFTKRIRMATPNGKRANSFIRFENITKTFREGDQERVVLQGVNAEIARGEFVAIVGRSGSGKSTLLNLLAGLDTPTRGDIFIGDLNIAKLNDNDRTLFRRKHIGFVFQFFNLIPTLTVRENVLMTAELAGWKESDAHAQANRLLDAVGLRERVNVFPDKLSGGEQQRVAIARALCADAELILADEPTGNLDAETGARILKLLTTLAREKNKTLVMVTHSSEIAEQADRVLRMEDGKLTRMETGGLETGD